MSRYRDLRRFSNLVERQTSQANAPLYNGTRISLESNFSTSASARDLDLRFEEP
jgi:hypothetical protein